MCLAAFPSWWDWSGGFRKESADVPQGRESAALVIVQFVETMTGIKAVQAYRREPRNQGSSKTSRPLPRRQRAHLQLLAIFMPV